MLARKLRRQGLGHKRAAAGRVAIDRNRNADAGPAQRDAALCAAVRDRFGQAISIIGIIDAFGTMVPTVGDLMPFAAPPLSGQALKVLLAWVGATMRKSLRKGKRASTT